MSNIRKPAVAGQFYPSSKQELIALIGSFIDIEAEKTDCIGCVLPHAGYAYSGRVAAKTISQAAAKEKVILFGPNHTGYGAPFSIATGGSWQTPLGDVPVDADLARKILSASKYLEENALAHKFEHSLEVQLPILQYLFKDFEIVPIAFMSQDMDALKKIGRDISGVVAEANLKGKCLFIASSDLTHYEPQTIASLKDKEAISAILELDEEKLAKKMDELNISMCGFAPVVTMLSLVKAQGAKSAKLIEYATSGDVTGDKTSVVGYAGMVIY